MGEGVILELLRSPQVEKVLSVSRRPVEINRYDCLSADEKNKLEEYIVNDMMTLKEADPRYHAGQGEYDIHLPERCRNKPKWQAVVDEDKRCHRAVYRPSRVPLRICLQAGIHALGQRAATHPENAVLVHPVLPHHPSVRRRQHYDRGGPLNDCLLTQRLPQICHRPTRHHQTCKTCELGSLPNAAY